MTTEGVDNERTAIEKWLAIRLYDPDLHVEQYNRMTTGQSNDTFAITATHAGETEQFVLRAAPLGPGLVEPYDMVKQYRVMAALAGSVVPVPKARWLETNEEVIGRHFFVMDYLHGTAFELTVPDYVREGGDELVQQMSRNFVRVFADLHQFRWEDSDLTDLDAGPGCLARELAWWRAEIARVRLGPTPALDALHDWLAVNMPAEPARRALVHGDCKWGNVMWDKDAIVGVLDFEMAQIGDPLVDIGYVTMLWELDAPTAPPGVIDTSQFLELYNELTGTPTEDIVWYQTLAAYKVAAICLVGSMLFAGGASDNLHYAAFGFQLRDMVLQALERVGVTDEPEAGAVLADAAMVAKRVDEVVYTLVARELTSEVALSQALALPTLLRYYADVGWDQR